MKLLALICLVLISGTPAVAAPLWVEDYCWAQAAQIRFNGRGEREAFIANCIANNVAEHTPPQAKTRYKKPR
jgi:hypothetical protein